MRKSLLGTAASAAVVAGIAVSAVLSTSSAAMAVTSVHIDETCKPSEPVSGAPFTISTTFNGTAPVSAAKGAVVTGSGVADPWTVPSDINNLPVTEVHDFGIRLVVSSNATVLNATLSGGSNYGTGTPSVTRTGNSVTLNVPGPLAPGSIVQLPAINFTIQAGTTSGTVTTSLTGTGFDDPGITTTGILDEDGLSLVVPATCYALTPSTLTSTVIR